MNRLLSTLDYQSVDCWISLGFAGGLAPDLKTGDILEGSTVRTPQGDIRASATGSREEKASSPLLYCAECVISTPREKRELYVKTGASAVDLESAAVAEHAGNRCEPFAWIRVISDAADEVVPPVLSQSIGEDGFPSTRAAVRVLAKQPWHLPLLLRHARRSHRCGMLLAVSATRWLERFEA
ncbi:MAG: hypothetical protein ACE15F_15435 [bacterium]